MNLIKALVIGAVWGGFLALTGILTAKVGWSFAVYSLILMIFLASVAVLSRHMKDLAIREMRVEMVAAGYVSMVAFKNNEMDTVEVELARKATSGDIPSLLELLKLRALNFEDFDLLPLDLNSHLGRICVESSKGHDKFFHFDEDNQADGWEFPDEKDDQLIH